MRPKLMLLVPVITFALYLPSLFSLPWTTASVLGQTVPTRVKSPTPGPPALTPIPPIITPPGIRDCRLRSPDANAPASQRQGLFDIFLPLVSRALTISIAGIGPTRDSYVGPCPGHFDFGAILSANGSGNGQFCWERSDGTTTEPQVIAFIQSGEQIVHDGWDIYSGGTFYEQLHLLAPNEIAGWVQVSNICW